MALPLRYNLLSLGARPTGTISSILLVAVIIATFSYLQAVTDSAFNTVAATGDPNTIIVIAQAAETETVSAIQKDQVNLLSATPEIESNAGGKIVSSELVAIGSAFPKDSHGEAVNTAVRGVDFPKANAVRHGKVKIIEGHPFNAGTYEVIVGSSVAKNYRGHSIGDEIQLGSRGMRKFKIVGIFDTGGTAADSEIWGYVETLRDAYGRQAWSSARMLVKDEDAARAAIDYLTGPSVGLNARTERDYFRSMNTQQKATQVLGLAMIIIMGIAAAFAVANTMYASVAGRVREIGMLRSIGFAPVSVLAAFMIEGVMLSLAGGLLGCLLSLLCNGMQKSMLPSSFTTVTYSLAITWRIAALSLAIALAIGVAGSFAPAVRAARLDVVRALREP